MANKKNKNRNRNRNRNNKSKNSNNKEEEVVTFVTCESVTKNGGYQIFVVNGTKLEAIENTPNGTFVFQNTNTYIVFSQLSVSFIHHPLSIRLSVCQCIRIFVFLTHIDQLNVRYLFSL